MPKGKNYLLDPTPEPGWTHGEILPYRFQGQGQRAKGSKVEFAPPNMLLQSIAAGKRLLQAPLNALTGQMSYEQMKAAAPEMAMTLLGAGLGTSSLMRMPPGDYLGSFKGYHGTPHSFDEFADHAIGSGEGAQSYGYGHYVAGNREVAEHYKNMLGGTKNPTVLFDDKPIWDNYGAIGDPGKELIYQQPEYIEDAAKALHIAGGDVEKAMGLLRSRALDPLSSLQNDPWAGMLEIKDLHSGNVSPQMLDAVADNAREALAYMQANTGQLKMRQPGGNLYHLEITPDEKELLSWDHKLLEQPDITAKLENLPEWFHDSLMSHAENFGMNHPLDAPGDYTGGQFYNAGSHHNVVDDPATLSQLMKEAGIPGIKYLDGFSRNKVGTANDIRVMQHGPDAFELRAYGDKGKKFTRDDAHDSMTRADLEKLLGPQVSKEIFSQLGEYSRPGVRAYSNTPVSFPGTYNYVIFDPKHIKIIGKD